MTARSRCWNVLQVASCQNAGAIRPAGTVTPVFQAIYGIRERRVVGFEALARLRVGDDVLMPDAFLPMLDAEGSLRLFHAVLAESIAFLTSLGPQAAECYLAINVGASTLMHRDFFEMLRFALACREHLAARLLIEILEGEAIADKAAMVRVIEEMKALGIAVALDDVGSAYASLVHIKDLPVDVLKLDQDFSRKLAERPEDLQFVASMLGLARGLERKLIVEGVETAEIFDALAVMGVEYMQGYGIVRPMSASAAIAWLKTGSITPPSREPTSLLGVYAAHLTIVEACRILASQPLRLRWHEDAADPHRCDIGRFFDRHGLHDTSFGEAHRRFHHSLTVEQGCSGAWRAAAEDLRRHLLAALRQDRELQAAAMRSAAAS